MRRVFIVAAMTLLTLIASTHGAFAQGSDVLTVAAASDLQTVMPAIVDRYQKTTGRTVRVTYGASGNFFSQLQNGAPFDVFFSADSEYPKRLEADGIVARDTIQTYAIGHLVLWAPTGSRFDVKRGVKALTDPSVRRIAIANPATAPYGRAAVSALGHGGVYERVRGKLVLGENVSQAAQFADTGNADAGIFALSIALSPALKGHGAYVDIPTSFYPPIEQAAAVVARSRHQNGARDFLAFFNTPEVVKLMTAAGFAVSTGGR